MKTCFKCNSQKALSEFYRHPKMADGHLGKCKECTKKDSRNTDLKLRSTVEGIIQDRARHRLKHRKYRASGRQKEYSKKAACLKKYRHSHPPVAKAHGAVHRAIRSGKLLRQPCEKCGAVPAQAHHPSYAAPLDVQWLCVTHHAEADVQRREAELRAKFTVCNPIP